MPASNAVLRDQQAYSAEKPSPLSLLLTAMKRSGRSALSLTREYLKLHRGPGKLTLPEYVQYGVYEAVKDGQDPNSFLTNMLHWQITAACCDMSWQAVTEDKWLCADILTRAGIPTAQTLAVIDRSDRRYPGAQKITTADELKAFALGEQSVPFFAKENRGICSFGAFLVTEADDQSLVLSGEGPRSYHHVMTDYIGSTPFLLQRVEKNHQFFDTYTNNLATVRVCILIDEDTVKIPFCVLKLPAKANLADSFWRPGNLAAKINPETGQIERLRSRTDFGTTDYDQHPETGAEVIGKTLPHWDQLIETVKNCAPIFQPVRYQSMDIAITEEGPVVIEVNTGGGFDLPQLATGEGFLTDEVRDFFRRSGYENI